MTNLGDADALGKSLDGRDDPVLPTLDGAGCGCRIVGPLGVGSLLADPPLVHKIIGGQVFAVAYCAGHRAAPALLRAAEFLVDHHLKVCDETCNLMGIDQMRAAIAKATGQP